MNAQTGIVNIRGKEYQTVALRVHQFRAAHPDMSLTTEIVFCDQECVRMKAAISDASGRVIATGHSEEYRRSSQINKTSALENAETSAIGRALAAFGIGGTEFASANEVENAIHQQAAGGQGQGDSHGEVSPPPAKQYDFPDGPARNITELKQMARELWREVEACGDDDMLTTLLEMREHKETISQLERLENPSHRQIWEGDGQDNPGLYGHIQATRARLKAELLRAG